MTTLLVEDRVEASLGGDGRPMETYAVVDLRRSPAELEDEDYEPGAVPEDPPAPDPPPPGLGCSETLLAEALGGDPLEGNESRLARVLVTGLDD